MRMAAFPTRRIWSKDPLAREARRRRSTKSELVRELLAAGLGEGGVPDLAQEARRQSLLVGRRRSERDALEFL